MKAPNNDVTIAPNFQLRLQYFLNWCLTLHYYQFPLLPKRIIQIISLPNSQALFDGTNSIAKKEAWRNEARNLTSTPSQCNRLIIYAWLTSLFFHLVPNSSWAGTGTLLLPHLFNRSCQPDASSTSSEPVQASTGFFWVYIHVKRIHSVDKVHRKRIHFRGSADCRVYHHSQILYTDSADGEEHAASRSTRGSLMEH